MSRTFSPQLAIAASASVLAMAAFALIGPVPSLSESLGGLPVAPVLAQGMDLPAVGQILPALR